MGRRGEERGWEKVFKAYEGRERGRGKGWDMKKTKKEGKHNELGNAACDARQSREMPRVSTSFPNANLTHTALRAKHVGGAQGS